MLSLAGAKLHLIFLICKILGSFLLRTATFTFPPDCRGDVGPAEAALQSFAASRKAVFPAG